MYRVFQAGLGARIEVQLNKNPHTTHSHKSWHCTNPSETKQNKTFLNKKHQPKPSRLPGCLVFFPTKTPQFPWVGQLFLWTKALPPQWCKRILSIATRPPHLPGMTHPPQQAPPGHSWLENGGPCMSRCISYIPASYVIVYQKVLEAIVSKKLWECQPQIPNTSVFKNPFPQMTLESKTDLNRPG